MRWFDFLKEQHGVLHNATIYDSPLLGVLGGGFKIFSSPNPAGSDPYENSEGGLHQWHKSGNKSALGTIVID